MKSFWEQFKEKEFNAEFLYTLVVAIALTGITYFFAQVPLTRDRMIPFRSVGFVLGSGAIFYFAVSIGVRQAFYLAVGVLTLIWMVWWKLSDLTSGQMLVCISLVTLYFIGLILLPNMIPWVMEIQAVELIQKNKDVEARAGRLQDELNRKHHQTAVEKAGVDKKEQIKLSSRSTLLSSFARDMVQAGSSAEILKALHSTVAKMVGVEECVMASVSADGREVSVTRALHPNGAKLEHAKLDGANPVLAKVLRTKAAVASSPPAPLMDGVVSRYAFPVVLDGQVIAVCNLGPLKAGDLVEEDEELVAVMCSMAVGAIELLRLSAGA